METTIKSDDAFLSKRKIDSKSDSLTVMRLIKDYLEDGSYLWETSEKGVIDLARERKRKFEELLEKLRLNLPPETASEAFRLALEVEKFQIKVEEDVKEQLRKQRKRAFKVGVENVVIFLGFLGFWALVAALAISLWQNFA